MNPVLYTLKSKSMISQNLKNVKGNEKNPKKESLKDLIQYSSQKSGEVMIGNIDKEWNLKKMYWGIFMKKKEIIEILQMIEKDEDIEILYACEAGSRAWGFANENSDYDVRFIYKKLNVKDYLSLNVQSDVIEYIGDESDIVGWDIKKALNLHYKNNPNLREWIMSREVYIDNGIDFMFSGLGGFEIDVLKNHYSSIAHKHWKKYCPLEFKEQKTKKYLYVIRSILCWKLLNRDIYPPINLMELLCHDFINLSDEIRNAVIDLVDFHKGKGDLSERTVFILNNFIMDSLSVMKTTKTRSFKNVEDYDERFRELLLVCR